MDLDRSQVRHNVFKEAPVLDKLKKSGRQGLDSNGVGFGGLITIAWSCIEKICYQSYHVYTSIYMDWIMECLP